jgi:hypothetical protein
MEVAGPIIAVIVFSVFIGLFVAAGFLLWGARIAGIENRTFGKALGTVILGGIAGFILSLVLSVVPVIGTVLGFIGGFIAEALVMMPIFKTTFGKALGASFLSWILTIVVLGGIALAVVAMLGGFAALS